MRVKRPNGQWVEIGGWGDQIYSLDAEDGTQWHWSVVAATAFAQARNEVGSISFQETGLTPYGLLQLYPDLNVAYALTTDLNRPLLFVPFDGDKVRLIDGYHRAMKALLLGIDVLPACYLTQEEADASLILKLSPEQALDWGQKQSAKQTLPKAGTRLARRR